MRISDDMAAFNPAKSAIERRVSSRMQRAMQLARRFVSGSTTGHRLDCQLEQPVFLVDRFIRATDIGICFQCHFTSYILKFSNANELTTSISQ